MGIKVLPAMPRKPKRNDEPAKIDSDVLRMARLVAAFDNMPLAELLSETLRPILLKRLETIKSQLPGKPKDK